MDERESLQSPDVSQRVSAAESLSLMGPDAAFAAVELVKACSDDDAVRDFAVAALEELGPPPTESLERLTELARDENSLVAYWAVTLLGRAEQLAQASEPTLVALLTKSKDPSVRERAAWALGKIGPNSAAAKLVLKQAASSSEPRLARVATASLEQTRP